MSNFDRNIFLNNISYLIKKNKAAVKDLENAADVSAGYFSRLNKPDSNTCPGIDVIYNVADYFDITIDTLVRTDLSDADDRTRYISEFIDKLILLTERRELKWERQYCSSISDSSLAFFLFALSSHDEDDSGKFFPGDVFYARITDKATVYLYQVTSFQPIFPELRLSIYVNGSFDILGDTSTLTEESSIEDLILRLKDCLDEIFFISGKFANEMDKLMDASYVQPTVFSDSSNSAEDESE